MGTYTRIDNNIMDFLISADISASELQIMIYLLRLTKGFSNRSTAKIAYRYVANGTGLSIPTVKRAILKFQKYGIITEIYPASADGRIARFEWSNLIRNGINSDTPSYQIRSHIRIKNDHQETKEEIKDKKEKIKKEASPPFSEENEGEAEEEMSDEEWLKMMEEDDDV